MTMLDGLPGTMVDISTVSALQNRAPKMCRADREWLIGQMEAYSIFKSVRDDALRAQLRRNIIDIESSIPSLYTFFEDLKYLSLCRKVVGKLLPPRLGHSVYTSLHELYKQLYRFEDAYKSL